jgi:hypothetical protein
MTDFQKKPGGGVGIFYFLGLLNDEYQYGSQTTVNNHNKKIYKLKHIFFYIKTEQAKIKKVAGFHDISILHELKPSDLDPVPHLQPAGSKFRRAKLATIHKNI